MYGSSPMLMDGLRLVLSDVLVWSPSESSSIAHMLYSWKLALQDKNEKLREGPQQLQPTSASTAVLQADAFESHISLVIRNRSPSFVDVVDSDEHVE